MSHEPRGVPARTTRGIARTALLLLLAVAGTGETCHHAATQPAIVPPSLGQEGDSALQAIERECSETFTYAMRFKKSPQASSPLAAQQINAYNALVQKLNALLDRAERGDQSSDQDFLNAAVEMVGDNAVYNSIMEGILGNLGPGQLGNYVLTHNETLPMNWVTLRSAIRSLSEPDRGRMSTYGRARLHLPVWSDIQ